MEIKVGDVFKEIGNNNNLWHKVIVDRHYINEVQGQQISKYMFITYNQKNKTIYHDSSDSCYLIKRCEKVLNNEAIIEEKIEKDFSFNTSSRMDDIEEFISLDNLNRFTSVVGETIQGTIYTLRKEVVKRFRLDWNTGKLCELHANVYKPVTINHKEVLNWGTGEWESK